MIEDILALARGLTEKLHTLAHVQSVVNTISEKKRALPSPERFMELSAEAGGLVLSNEDVHLLTQLNDVQKAPIRNLYIPFCTCLDNNLVKTLSLLPAKCRGIAASKRA